MRRLFLMLPNKRKFIYGILFLIGLSITQIASANFIKRLADAATSKDLSGFYYALYLILIITIFEVVFSYLRTRLLGSYTESGVRFLRNTLSNKYNQLEMNELTTRHSGDYVSRATNDVNKVQSFITSTLPGLVYNPLTGIGAFIYLLILNYKLTLISVFIVPLGFLCIALLSKPLKNLSKNLQEKLSESNIYAQDYIKGVEVSKAYNLERNLKTSYSNVIFDSVEYGKKIAKHQAILRSFSGILSLIPFFVTFFIGGYYVIEGEMTIGSLLAFINLLNYVANPMLSIPRLIGQYKVESAAIERIYDVIDLNDERIDGIINHINGAKNIIEFSNVHFKYPNNNQWVLKNLDLHIKKGESVAIVGPSGGGKSTIIQLLLGYYDQYEGHIKISENDLKDWNLKKLREQIALVSQDTFLFPESIEENIRYGNLHKDVTYEEIVEATKSANAYHFINEFDNQFDTQIGELGNRLSGGQKQRIAIARAIIKDADILLLDEATSSLDNESESIVQEAIDRLLVNKTSLIIAHRLSTIKNVDRIIVIDNGQIVETGTHDDLMKQNSLYRNLYNNQLKVIDVEGMVA